MLEPLSTRGRPAESHNFYMKTKERPAPAGLTSDYREVAPTWDEYPTGAGAPYLE